MQTVGVDLGGRKIACAVFDNGYLTRVHARSLPATIPRGQALSVLAWDVVAQTATTDVVFYIEEPLVGRGVRASLQIAQTAGALLATINKTPAHLVPVATWKKAVVGRGNADKLLVKSWLESHYPAYAQMCEGNQDKIDAVCIGLYGVANERAAQRLVEDL